MTNSSTPPPVSPNTSPAKESFWSDRVIIAAMIGAVAAIVAAIITVIGPPLVPEPDDLNGSTVMLTNLPTATQTVLSVATSTPTSMFATVVVNVARGRDVVVLTVERPVDLSDMVIGFGSNESYRLGDELSNSFISDVLCVRQSDSTTQVDGCIESNTIMTENTVNSWRNAELVFAWRGNEVDRCPAEPTISSGLYACDALTLTF